MLRGAAAMSVVLEQACLSSPLKGVSDAAYARLVDALSIDDDAGPNYGRPRPFDARTHAGGLGCFGILPRRLVDIGVARAVRIVDGKAYVVDLQRDFLVNPLVQRDALGESLLRYDVDEVSKLALPRGITRAGVLALYHRLGPQALQKWQRHKQQATIVLFRRANGLF